MSLAISVFLAQVASFGSNPGALDMYEYVPTALPAGRPLVVVMHGCTQNASSMEVAGWNALADQYQFAVLYPQQRSANQQLDCFTWYGAADIARTGGEAESIIQMVDTEISTHAIDRTRVYATGVSAGGAFTAVMLAAYPDRFAAGSSMSGVAYDCATDLTGATACTQGPVQKSPSQWGDLARAGDPGFTGPWPRMQVWQGTADHTVDPANASELVAQWTNLAGIDQMATATDTISTATRTRYGSAVELYLVNGMGHAIATGNDAMGACPASSGAFFSDEKICSTLRAADFFGLLPGDGSGSGSGSGSDGSGQEPPAPGADGGCSTGAGAGWGALLALAMCRRGRTRAARPRCP
jgi:poly(hydroxyalkanoate) depolymerase family esterase